MGLSAGKIKEMMIMDLGGGSVDTQAVVDVELNEDNVKNIIARAKMWYNARKGYVVWRPVQVAPTITTYKMKDDVDNIQDVIFQVPSDVAAFFTMGFFDIIPYGPQYLGSVAPGMANYSEFAQLLNFTEERKRVFSVEPDWFYEQPTNTLHITQRSGMNPMIALVKAKLTEWDVASLRGWDSDIFYRYCLAHAKEVVGRIRSKYDSLPAAGGSVTLDGSKLLEEAKEDKIQLDTEIFASQGPDIPMMG